MSTACKLQVNQPFTIFKISLKSKSHPNMAIQEFSKHPNGFKLEAGCRALPNNCLVFEVYFYVSDGWTDSIFSTIQIIYFI